MKIYRKLQILMGGLSGEWMLTRAGKANGGTIIVLRSLHTSLIIFACVIFAINVLDPNRGWEFSVEVLQTQVMEKITWLGALFAAVYVALYTRFASQWLYLANNYLDRHHYLAQCENSV